MTQRVPKQNHVPVRQLYEELFTHGRYEMVGDVFHNACPVHFGNRHVTLDDAVNEGKGWRSAAPNLVMTVDHITETGDIVQVSWTARGTHTGEGHGLKPSRRTIVLRGNSRFLVINGKIAEAWNEEYRPELLHQLGVSRPRAFMLLLALNTWSMLKSFVVSLTG
jgi:predicted ester cyclase